MARTSRRAGSVRVVLVRHGPAEDPDPVRWPNDDRRPLSHRGRVQTKHAAKGLARVTSPIDRLVSSSATRAVSTAQFVRDALGSSAKIETWPELDPGNLPTPIFDKLRRSLRPGQEAVLVGHEPTLAEFVGMALLGEGLSVVHLTKGGAACLEFPTGVKPGAGKLVWLFTRKQLADERG